MTSSGLDLNQLAMCNLIRNRKVEQKFDLKGHWKFELLRNGIVIKKWEFYNDIVNVGKNDIFNVYFHSGTQTATGNWFIGLISNTGYSGLAATDTMGSHAGWTELTTFTQATRVAWTPGAAASQSITNPTPNQFDINATGTVKGVFVVNDSTKGGNTGTLWATALYPADVPVNTGLMALLSSNVKNAPGYMLETPSIPQYALAA
jgi:hypothetical protein